VLGGAGSPQHGPPSTEPVVTVSGELCQPLTVFEIGGFRASGVGATAPAPDGLAELFGGVADSTIVSPVATTCRKLVKWCDLPRRGSRPAGVFGMIPLIWVAFAGLGGWKWSCWDQWRELLARTMILG